MKRTLFAISSVALLDFFSFNVIFMLAIQLFFNPRFDLFGAQAVTEGIKNVQLGILVALFSFFMLFGAPFWGEYGDKFGRKKALLITLLGTLIANLLCFVAIWKVSYLLLLLGRSLGGFFAGNIALCFATLSDFSDHPKKTAKYYGYLTSLLGISTILAFVMSSLFAFSQRTGAVWPLVPFLLAGALALLSIVIVWFFYHTKKHLPATHFNFHLATRNMRDALQSKKLRTPLLALFFWSVGWTMSFQWTGVSGYERFHLLPKEVAAYFISAACAYLLGGIILNPVLVKRFSNLTLAIFATSIMTAALFIAAFSTVPLLFFLCFLIAILFSPVAWSQGLSYLMSTHPYKMQGLTMGFAQGLQTLAATLGPLISGVIFGKSHFSLIFFIGTIVLFISLMIFKNLRLEE